MTCPWAGEWDQIIAKQMCIKGTRNQQSKATEQRGYVDEGSSRERAGFVQEKPKFIKGQFAIRPAKFVDSFQAGKSAQTTDGIDKGFIKKTPAMWATGQESWGEE